MAIAFDGPYSTGSSNRIWPFMDSNGNASLSGYRR